LQTIDQLIRDREGDTRVGLAFSDRTWTHAEVVRAQAERAALLLSLRQPGPFHVALLMDNVPEYVFWMGAPPWPGPSSSGQSHPPGDELARDLSHTECQLLVTNSTYRQLVEGHDLGPALPPDASWWWTTRPVTRRPPAGRTTGRSWPAWPGLPCPTRRRWA